MSTASIRRVTKELKDLMQKPIREFVLVPLESNVLEVHFTMMGPEDSPYAGGLYHGRVLIPNEYPFAPPDVVLLTPNGRFETSKKVCLSVSSYHPEHWKATWGISTILHSLRNFMLTAGTNGIASMNLPAEKRRELANESRHFECKECGVKVIEQWEEIMKDAPPATDADKGELLPPMPPTPPVQNATQPSAAAAATATTSSSGEEPVAKAAAPEESPLTTAAAEAASPAVLVVGSTPLTSPQLRPAAVAADTSSPTPVRNPISSSSQMKGSDANDTQQITLGDERPQNTDVEGGEMKFEFLPSSSGVAGTMPDTALEPVFSSSSSTSAVNAIPPSSGGVVSAATVSSATQQQSPQQSPKASPSAHPTVASSASPTGQQAVPILQEPPLVVEDNVLPAQPVPAEEQDKQPEPEQRQQQQPVPAPAPPARRHQPHNRMDFEISTHTIDRALTVTVSVFLIMLLKKAIFDWHMMLFVERYAEKYLGLVAGVVGWGA